MYTCEASALDLFTDSLRLMGDATLCAVMEFDRRIESGRLRDAAQACLRAHPILRSRLVRGRGPAYWEMDETVSHAVIRAETCSNDYFPGVTGPVDPRRPLQFRVRLLRRPSGDVVVVNLAHAAADAFGLHALMAQLLQEYREPGSIRPAEGSIPARDTLWTREFSTGEPPVHPETRVIDPMWPDPFGTSDRPTAYHRERIDPAGLAAIRASARSAGGSINDAVLAAYFLAMSDLTGLSGPFPLFFPVNLRQHLRDGSRVMSNQATNVCISIRRAAGDGMADVLSRVIDETRRQKAGRIGIAEQVAMDASSDPAGENIHTMVEKMAALQREGLADIFISNPGPVELPDIDGLTGAYVAYPGGYMPTTCFITSTFRDRMTVTMGYQDSGKARAGTRKAMDLFLHHLLALADAK